MKKVIIIYNPRSGSQFNKRLIYDLCNEILDNGHIVRKIETKSHRDTYEKIVSADKQGFDIVIVCGGDGTVNEAVNSMAKIKSKMTLGVLPLGTVNDFAKYMGYNSPRDLVDLIEKGGTKKIDVGVANEKYFINVAACGKLANVGHETDQNLKAIFGKLAYLAEGIKAIPESSSFAFELEYTIDNKVKKDSVFLILIANTSSIGGFKKLAPNASISDGLLDILIIKNTDSIANLAQIFFQILAGDHITNNNVEYFQTNEIKLSSSQNVTVDVDGEYAGELPIKIMISDYKVSVLSN